MSQVPVVPPLAPVVPDIMGGCAACQAIHKKLGVPILEKLEDRSLESRSKYETDPEVQESKD